MTSGKGDSPVSTATGIGRCRPTGCPRVYRDRPPLVDGNSVPIVTVSAIFRASPPGVGTVGQSRIRGEVKGAATVRERFAIRQFHSLAHARGSLHALALRSHRQSPEIPYVRLRSGLVDYGAVPRLGPAGIRVGVRSFFDAGGVAVVCADVLNRSVARSLSLRRPRGGAPAGRRVRRPEVRNETLYGPTGEPQKHTDPLVVPEVDPAAASDAGSPAPPPASRPASARTPRRRRHQRLDLRRRRGPEVLPRHLPRRRPRPPGPLRRRRQVAWTSPAVVILPTERDTYPGRPPARPSPPPHRRRGNCSNHTVRGPHG